MTTVGVQSYRIYFLNARNRITDSQVVDCVDDDSCVQQALALLHEHPEYWAVEIWQDSRKIGTYTPPPAISAANLRDTSSR
jgi:hypothetical protein